MTACARLGLLGAPRDDPDTIWILLLDAVAPLPDGHGAGAVDHVVLLDRGNLHNLVSRYPNESVGAIAHELGHAFGLPHPPICDSQPFRCRAAAQPFLRLGSTTLS